MGKHVLWRPLTINFEPTALLHERAVAGIMKPCALLKLDFLTSAYKKCMR